MSHYKLGDWERILTSKNEQSQTSDWSRTERMSLLPGLESASTPTVFMIESTVVPCSIKNVQ